MNRSIFYLLIYANELIKVMFIYYNIYIYVYTNSMCTMKSCINIITKDYDVSHSALYTPYIAEA